MSGSEDIEAFFLFQFQFSRKQKKQGDETHKLSIESIKDNNYIYTQQQKMGLNNPLPRSLKHEAKYVSLQTVNFTGFDDAPRGNSYI